MKKIYMNSATKVKVKRILATMFFGAILLEAFLSATYLFRNSGENRLRIIGLKKEEHLDVVYIGGSSVNQFWEPLKAWADCGFTSYNLATEGIQAESIRYLVKYALRYHRPELFVIDVRAFQAYNAEESNGNRLRNTSDSLDFTVERLNLIYEYLNQRKSVSEEGTKDASYYLDIMKYHMNHSALASQENWRLIKNTGSAINKGYGWHTTFRYLDQPEYLETDTRADLSEGCTDTLYALLDFCQEKELNALFVVCPYQIKDGDWETYNTLEDIITSYGFDFLNTNKCYEEMGIDFSTDFYDIGHVNTCGAGKYTEYLENYMVEHYNLPDHRKDEIYASWNKDSAQFLESEKRMNERINVEISKALEGKEIADSICATTDLLKWCALANDPRFTILAVGNEFLPGGGKIRL